MAIEIERKYLVLDTSYRDMAESKTHIAQGYISQDPERTVRVRIKGNKGYITIKGIPNELGWSRYEFEKEISLEEANELLKLCIPPIIDKVRHNIPYKGITVEVDEFAGENEGLIMAEIELESEDQIFEKPAFIGQEVTGDIRYYNVQLSKTPYKMWKK